MRITAAGNVGIGTTSPGQKLDVDGIIVARNEVHVWGNNGFLSGQLTANSAGGGVYIGAFGTNQSIRLVPSGTGIVQIPGTSNLAVGGIISIGTGTAMLTSSVSMNDGAAAAAGTLLNAPAAGNPTKWIPFNDNGTTRYIPAW